jgi:hypothetical protein
LLGLRALGAAGVSMRARLISALPTVVLPVLFGAFFDARGFGVGLLIATILSTGLLWRGFMKVLPRIDWAV